MCLQRPGRSPAWYDKEAKEAAHFYTSIFPESKITNITTLHDTPSGDCDVVDFELAGQPFMAISAGPLFKFNESISFICAFTSLFTSAAVGGLSGANRTVPFDLS
ncbi:MAG: hypothetical protein E6J43_06620 [Chloroflexi bacterium]|nr:MAG: hypothetical protein E6J43_06620 [Chloroflexota bacterium]